MKIVENKMAIKIIRFFKAESKQPGKGTLFAYLTVSLILLYVVNNLRYMGITQLDEKKLVSCMWSANIALGIAVIGNFSLILKRPVWLYFLVQMLIDAAAINSVFFVYKLYPFTFRNTVVNDAIHAVLIFIAACLFVAFLVEFYRFGINVHLPKKKVTGNLGPSSGAPGPDGDNQAPQKPDEIIPPVDQSLSPTSAHQSDSAARPAMSPDMTPPSSDSYSEDKSVLTQKPNEIETPSVKPGSQDTIRMSDDETKPQ